MTSLLFAIRTTVNTMSASNNDGMMAAQLPQLSYEVHKMDYAPWYSALQFYCASHGVELGHVNGLMAFGAHLTTEQKGEISLIEGEDNFEGP